MSANLTPAPKPGYRPGVGVMLLNKAGLVFVAQRIDTRVEAWQMPQGGIDGGETPREAALRELEEEIGTANVRVLAETDGWLNYDLPDELKGKVWGGKWPGQTQKWFACLFLGADDEIDLETEHPEFSEWRWVPMSALGALIVPFKRPLYEDLVSELGPAASRKLSEIATEPRAAR
jgi:putative (di)nucleoside polyphosphate hydrolase